MKYAAKKRGYKWTLTNKQVRSIMSQPCHYCGAKPSNIDKPRLADGAFIYSGLDRVNNKLGYSQKNCVPCCKHCNRAKETMTLKEFRDWSRALYKRFNNPRLKSGACEENPNQD